MVDRDVPDLSVSGHNMMPLNIGEFEIPEVNLDPKLVSLSLNKWIAKINITVSTYTDKSTDKFHRVTSIKKGTSVGVVPVEDITEMSVFFAEAMVDGEKYELYIEPNLVPDITDNIGLAVSILSFYDTEEVKNVPFEVGRIDCSNDISKNVNSAKASGLLANGILELAEQIVQEATTVELNLNVDEMDLLPDIDINVILPPHK